MIKQDKMYQECFTARFTCFNARFHLREIARGAKVYNVTQEFTKGGGLLSALYTFEVKGARQDVRSFIDECERFIKKL